jgi:uncharacterized protein (UPF0333 family)
MSSILSPTGCAKFNSNFLYYIGILIFGIIMFMLGKNTSKKSSKEAPKAAPKAKAKAKKAKAKKSK